MTTDLKAFVILFCLLLSLGLLGITDTRQDAQQAESKVEYE